MSYRRALKWTRAQVPDQTGRRILITGASSGIGAAAALLLADRGAHIILAVRNPAKADTIAQQMPGAEVRAVDLASFASIRAFAASQEEPIDVLINNAGVMSGDFAKTVDGFEQHFGVNHLAPFLLTQLLLPKIRDRIVAVSSHAHRVARVDAATLEDEARGEPFEGMRAYGLSKLANLLFTAELARRLEGAGSRVRAVAAHPGLARSSLLETGASTRKMRITRRLQGLLGQSTEMGALPLVHAATADLPTGAYVGPGGFYELAGLPKRVEPQPQAADAEAAAALWALSERLTGDLNSLRTV